MKKHLLRLPGLCVALGALSASWCNSTFAQEAPSEDTSELEEVMVSGSRIVRDGFLSPTPVSVLSSDDINAAAPVTIADFVNTLPSLSGSLTPRTQMGAISGGTSGINALNLRALGATRTLVLLDGQRVVGSALTGIVDVNAFPQALISRVDVVTGGASAAWGSDAVSGVINFVLDKTFTGLKGEVKAGATDYGDDRTISASLTGGMGFADGRGHVLLSLEDMHNDGVQGAPRPWLDGWQIVNNPNYTATNGEPRLLALSHVGESTGTPGAIVVSGPLRGTYFGSGGTPGQLNYGPIVSDPFMSGGDWEYANFHKTGDLDPRMSHQSAFGRISYNLTDDVEVFAQASWGRTGIVAACCDQYNLGGITIQRDNAYLPASVGAAMDSLGMTSLTVGSLNADLPVLSADNERKIERYSVGANGRFSALGSLWRWDAYAVKGIGSVHQSAVTSITANYRRAIDAVVDPTSGAIVCRSTLTDPTNGCSPYNILGTGVASQTAVDYVVGRPWGDIRLTQSVTAATLRGEPFSTWAGPVSVATGIEYRKEEVGGSNDPLTETNSYWAGNYRSAHGSYNVKEAFFESVIPLASDLAWAKSLEFNGAVRATDYSLSGYVTTWKAGLNYAPIPDVRFRVTRSRDIRAPNLAELFQGGQTSVNSLTDPFRGNSTYTYYQATSGNLNLKPESADSTEFGVIFQPRFLPGFTASVDYYDIDISGAIASITSQNIVNACYNGVGAACPQIIRDGSGLITQINVQPINLVTLQAKGIDIETSYRLPLWRGDMALRALATHYIDNYTNNGINPPVDTAGTNSGSGPPSWQYLASITYAIDPMSITLTGRGLSSGINNATYIECTLTCPTSTTDNQTIDDNHLAGAIYFDVTATYGLRGFGSGSQVYLKVENLANKAPAPVPAGASIAGALIGTNATFYDILGRTYRAGLRFEF